VQTHLRPNPVSTSARPPFSEAEILSAVILGQLGRSSPSSGSQIPLLLQPAIPTIRNIWADRTWRARADLLRRLRAFSDSNNINDWPMSTQALAMISSLQVSPQTKYSYAKTFAALSRRFGMEAPLLDAYIAALRASGATIPMEQAAPAAREDVLFLMSKAHEQENPTFAVLVYLMWKTASRYDDVTRLTKESIIFAEDNVLVIEWPTTKTTRSDPFRVSGWTVLVEENLPSMLFDTMDAFHDLPPKTRITTTQTGSFTRWLHTFEETRQLTCHSFKRGAVGHLVHMAAQGLLDPRIIPVIAKHKDPLRDFPVTTIRYAPNKVEMAMMFGTQHATRLL
jgi:hypothetical protein